MSHTVCFTDEEWTFYYNLCHQYACDELESTFEQRKRRNQFNKNAMITQTTCGKLAEWACTLYFLDKGEPISDPDMEIYTASKKSFDADLQVDGHDLHVKSQTTESATRFGTSWMFQYSGKGTGHCDPLLKKENGLVAFCVVDMKSHKVQIVGVCEFDKIRHKLREPMKEVLKKTKRCIYLEDLCKNDFININ